MALSVNEASASGRRRWVTSVDLGDLRPHVERASASAGVGPSTWLRNLVLRDLAGGPEQLAGCAIPSLDRAANPPLVYRAWLDAGLTAKLDERRRRDGFRSRAAVLRALIDGVGIAQGDRIRSGALGVSDDGRSVSLREVVDALGASNFQLVSIGRNINQVAKMLRASPGASMATDRQVLEAAAMAIRQHIDQASKLVGHLRPMLRRAE